LDWSLEIASLSDVEMSKRWIGAVDPNGVARLPPNGGWDWVKLYNGYLKNPSAFVCAIKSEGKLCALIGGGVSDSKVVTKLHYLESAPMTRLFQDMHWIFLLRMLLLSRMRWEANTQPSMSQIAKSEIAINDYGFSEDNLGQVKISLCIYQ
jgi:hypothetical protein